MGDTDTRTPETPHGPLLTVTACIVMAACSWFLLKELASLLRPLFLAIFLCYVIVPLHRRLTNYVPPLASMLVLAAGSLGLIYLLAFMIYSNVVELYQELPALIERAQDILKQTRTFALERMPAWLAKEVPDTTTVPRELTGKLHQIVGTVVNIAADGLAEAVLVGIYLLFLLLEAHSMPRRIRSDFEGGQAGRILDVIRRINQAMTSYLRIKVWASLVLALPVTLILWAFGVPFPVMWGVFTFLLNFIPYLGSVVACSLPILLAWLQLGGIWQPTAVSVLLVIVHMLSAYVVEPSMTGRAIGLSPLVILLALSFWSLCWGLTGMLLAVPLTVMIKIVLENIELTRPFARLMADESITHPA